MVFLAALWFGTPRIHQRVLVIDNTSPGLSPSTHSAMATYDLADPFERTLQKIQANVLLSLKDQYPDVEVAANTGTSRPAPPVQADPRILMRAMHHVSLLDNTLKDPPLIHLQRLIDTQSEKASDRVVRALGMQTVPSILT